MDLPCQWTPPPRPLPLAPSRGAPQRRQQRASGRRACRRRRRCRQHCRCHAVRRDWPYTRLGRCRRQQLSTLRLRSALRQSGHQWERKCTEEAVTSGPRQMEAVDIVHSARSVGNAALPRTNRPELNIAMRLFFNPAASQAKLAAEKAEWLELSNSVQRAITETPVELNVGGKHFQTSAATLGSVQGSFFDGLVSGRANVSPCMDGSYFIDRPSQVLYQFSC
ncbi:hypothetical protein JKP88DRAFT_242704 [Tribonema minus]|uniref:Potassium channel tetramerisation-type BTB domain-containing protein n=1 Tax=Tribonema minus TaxID=303371 RepID=A0A836CCX1_9STRA|nr:hypothetical protein JKP88DRAFT_256048 [Tribonema minus]KAG5191833.1 hypothetical protein JKP88DRAFT_242704 [Tribonema minus]